MLVSKSEAELGRVALTLIAVYRPVLIFTLANYHCLCLIPLLCLLASSTSSAGAGDLAQAWPRSGPDLPGQRDILLLKVTGHWPRPAAKFRFLVASAASLGRQY